MAWAAYVPISVGIAIAVHFEVWLRLMDLFGVGWEKSVREALVSVFGSPISLVNAIDLRIAIGRSPSWMSLAAITFFFDL